MKIKEDNSESEDDEQNLEKKKEADTETKDQVTDAGEDDDDDIWNFGDEDDAKKRTEAEDPAEKRQKLSVSGLKERHKRQPVGYQLERRFMEMEEGLYFSFAKFTTISLEQQEAVRFIIATKAQYTRNETSDSYFELARTYFIKTIQVNPACEAAFFHLLHVCCFPTFSFALPDFFYPDVQSSGPY